MSIEGVKARRLRAAVFLRINTNPVARAWTGVGGFVLPPSAVDPTGGRYKGMGWMRNLPALELLLNGRAESLTFTVSGVDARTIDLIDAAEGVEGVRANLGIMFHGPRFVRRPVHWFRRFRVDMVGHTSMGLSVDSGEAASVEHIAALTLGSRNTSRRVGQPSRWTHAEQIRLFPADMGCALAGRLGADATRPWPPKN